jgi:alpha-beta hydrolase superfamily lysophospholipase
MSEQAVAFGPRQSLIGVVTWPPPRRGGTDAERLAVARGPLASVAPDPEKGIRSTYGLPAVLLLNSGILHRVGPNRIYVKIARSLAALGFVVLRFDFSGIGDSPARDDNLLFEQSSLQDIEQAMAMLHSLAGSNRFVLAGLCSGAQVAFQGALTNHSVIGAVMINAGGHLHDDHNADLSMALFHRGLRNHYLRIALHSSFRSKNWLKVRTGDLNLRLLWGAARHFRLRNPLRRQRGGSDPQEYALAHLATLSERGVRLLHIYAEGDQGLDYFRLLLGKQALSGNQPMELIRGANHTFSTLWSQERLVQVICDWARAFIPSRKGDTDAERL